jgi:hypothetical protein
MSFVDRARWRLAVHLSMGVSLLIAVACASRGADDLFDSTPGEPTGSPSGGQAPVGAIASGGSKGVIPSSGGMPAVSPSETGGTSGSGGSAPSAGAPAGPAEASGGSGGANLVGGSNAGASAAGGGGNTTGGATTGGDNAGGNHAAAGKGGSSSCQADVERCDGTDNDCDGDADEGDACPENCSGFAGLDSTYMFCLDPSTASAAQSACNDAGMRLSWVETADENQFLLEHGAKLSGVEPGEVGHGEDQDQMRLGGSDQEEEGRWHWVAAEPGPLFWKQTSNARQPWQGEVADGLFANWSEERPNQDVLSSSEDCLVMELEDGGDGNAGEWNDVGCSTRHPFVCETP